VSTPIWKNVLWLGLPTQCRKNNIPISEPILKEKSKLFATNLGITNFQASEGWSEKFKKRYFTFKKVC